MTTQQHDYMMECLTNIAGHIHLMQGFIDALYPVKGMVHAHEPTLMPKLVDMAGRGKVITKLLAKKMIRDDQEAIDIMYEQVGKTISLMAKLSYGDARKLTEELNDLTERFEPIKTT
jgi:hypothetical protein